MSTKRCLIYCRVSDPRQVTEGASLTTQEELLREYAANNDYEVAEIFIEPGESAKTADRTELKRMMAYARTHRGKLDAVLVYKFNRFARYVEDHHQLRGYFRSIGIQVVSISERVDDTPAGRLHETILAAINQFDNEDRAENCRNGMIRAVKDGRYVWRPPVGYNYARVDGRPNLVPDPQMAPLVRQAFELIATGLNRPDHVRKMVEAEGLRGKSGQAISRTRFHVMIRNPIYMGILESFGLRIEGSFEPIVSPPVFFRAQRVLENLRRKLPTRYRVGNPEFPLRRLLLCGNCGQRLTASRSRGRNDWYSNYRCARCRGKQSGFPSSEAHERFKDLLRQYQFTEEFSRSLRLTLQVEFRSRTAGSLAKRTEIEKERKRIQADKKALIIRDLRGEYSDRRMVNELLADFDMQLARLTDDEKRIESYDELEQSLSDLFKMLQDLADVWEHASLETQVRFQKLLFPEGAKYTRKNGFGTIPSSLLLTLKSNTFSQESRLVDQTDDKWNQLVGEIDEWIKLLHERNLDVARGKVDDDRSK